MLKNFCYQIHWIPGHAEISIHKTSHRCAQIAAKHYNKIPKFPPKFKISVFAKGPKFYALRLYDPAKTKIPNKIYPPPMEGNTSLLVTKFFINYLISNPKKVPKIQQNWFDPFDRSEYAVPPPWKNNHHLVTALRTPYVVTHHLPSTPHNALGWTYYQDSPELPEFGFFEAGSACNQLFLHVLTEHEINFLYRKIEQSLQTNKTDPWRFAFFISEKEEKYLREFPDTISTKIATFTVGMATIHLQCIENEIAHKLDPPMHNKLEKWLQQFSNHQIHISPSPSSTLRRSIQSYFQPELPTKSTILSQSYMKYLQPHNLSTNTIDPTINLIGFHPHFRLHISEIKNCNRLMNKIYNHHCYKYNKIKRILSP